MKNHMIIDHEYVNCPLRFDDRIRPANLLPIHMFDFDVILGMDWLASHRATIDCYARTFSGFCYGTSLESTNIEKSFCWFRKFAVVFPMKFLTSSANSREIEFGLSGKFPGAEPITKLRIVGNVGIERV
ncbi:putative reverse transcriptase domain-containing protein [Tanacetum coccineum]